MTFNFLGFTHYCSTRTNGSYRVKRKTDTKKMRSSLMKVKEWLKENMHLPVYQLIGKLNRKLNGYYRYYGITDNYSYLKKYLDIVKRHLFKVLNRISQRRRYNWQGLN